MNSILAGKYMDDTLQTQINEEQRSMNQRSLFFLWFGSNLTVADFALGVLVESYGMSVFYTLLALVIANSGGGALVAVMSYLGPKTGLGQMEISKRSLGTGGGKIFSLLQFMNTVGWLSVNLIISARALQFVLTDQHSTNHIFMGLDLMELLSLFLVMLFISLTVVYGHKTVKSFEKIMSVVLGIMFLFLSISIIISPSRFISAYSGNFSIVAFTSVIMLSFSYIMSWAPYAADYSRYIPGGKNKQMAALIFTLLGSGIASFLVEVIGFYVGIDLNLDGIFTNSLFVPLLGGVWFIGSITLFLGGLSANALNIYSNLMSIRALGFKAARKYIIFIVGALTIIMGLLFYSDFSSYFEGFLYVLDYWITPWIGVMIGEYFIGRRTEIFKGKINLNPIIAYVFSITLSIPFMDTIQYYFNLNIPFYAITFGVDYSYLISFVLAILLTSIFESKIDLNGRVGKITPKSDTSGMK